GRIGTSPAIPLDGATWKATQAFIDKNEQPFRESLRHLHRAMTGTHARHSWIDATIAAELAIKEFLIRFKPDIKTLLLEVPSPPLHKMYGSVLESFIGERSPRVKEIAKGAEIRNVLIHRPEETKITDADAHDYVEYVQVAILHLYGTLYPDDGIVRQL